MTAAAMPPGITAAPQGGESCGCHASLRGRKSLEARRGTVAGAARKESGRRCLHRAVEEGLEGVLGVLGVALAVVARVDDGPLEGRAAAGCAREGEGHEEGAAAGQPQDHALRHGR